MIRELKSDELSFVSGGQAQSVQLTPEQVAEATAGDGTPTRTWGGYYECLSLFTDVGGLGGSVCQASTGDIYVAAGLGTPGASYHAGITDNLDGYMTGFTLEGQTGSFFAGGNLTSAGDGYSYGTPGASATYGFNATQFLHDFGVGYDEMTVQDF